MAACPLAASSTRRELARSCGTCALRVRTCASRTRPPLGGITPHRREAGSDVAHPEWGNPSVPTCQHRWKVPRPGIQAHAHSAEGPPGRVSSGFVDGHFAGNRGFAQLSLGSPPPLPTLGAPEAATSISRRRATRQAPTTDRRKVVVRDVNCRISQASPPRAATQSPHCAAVSMCSAILYYPRIRRGRGWPFAAHCGFCA